MFSLFYSSNQVPVTANILLPKGRVYSVGSDISLYCNVTGEPTPDVTWYKDNRPLEVSNHVEIPGMQYSGINLLCQVTNKSIISVAEPNRIIVVEAQPFDSGNYRCVARNDYSQAFAAEVISVEGKKRGFVCVDSLL